MRIHLIPRLWVAGLLAFGASFVQAQHQQIKLTRIGPTVSVTDLNGERAEFTANGGEEVYENDLVVTSGTGSRVILVFSNGSTINVGEESKVEIRQFYQDPFASDFSFAEATSEPAGSRSETKIHLSQGELIGNVKSLNAGSTFDVTTPAGAAGIRGTTFRVVFRPTGDGTAFFTVTTVEGNVLVIPIGGTVETGSIPVTDLEEIEIVVEVDDSTGEVTSITPVGEAATTTADAATVAAVTEVVQEAAQEVATIVLTETASQQGDGAPSGTSGDEGDEGDEGDNEDGPDPDGPDPDGPDTDGPDTDGGDAPEGEAPPPPPTQNTEAQTATDNLSTNQGGG